MRTRALLLFLVGCSVDRSTPDAGGGVHPAGWGDRASPSFHATWLASSAFPLARCKECHGDDFSGGAVGVPCAQSGCHSQRPDACTTCHGSRDSPRPDLGAHWAHAAFCDTCHRVPTTTQVEQHASGDAGAIVQFSGLARADGGEPAWDPSARRCSGAYCHQSKPTPEWTDPTPIGCDGCHDAPPANHARWARLATTPSSCATCHPGPDDPRHVNGTIDVTVTSCTTCHGADDHANPPSSLDGSTDPTSRGVGAHDRHLNAALADRIGRPLLCDDCHDVPSAVRAPGHYDAPSAVVRFSFGGTYDAAGQTCNVWCHFNRAPGPTWTDASGAARACDACHDFPPRLTRAGAQHPSVAADANVCKECHVFQPSTHVNGVVDFVNP
jgi:predicted CxxxxCH...CXXCH cytochrome family protein